jgi:uncharacterized membrane protein YsdA (DUF1294 family)
MIAGYFGILALLSVGTFAAYGRDKYLARLNRRRWPERNLHVLTVLGGWPGAWLGQYYFRHKTRKFDFQVIYWTLVVLHLVVVATIYNRLS